MPETATIMLTGIVMGLASALHCASMCGGISLTLLALLHNDPKSVNTSRRLILPLLMMQAGRITTYAVLGTIAGLTGAALAGLALEPRLSAQVLQWAGAASLMWIGFSIAGVVPEFALPLAASSHTSRFIEAHLQPLRRHRSLGSYATGLSWFICPCPIVHAALFSAMLTGSASGGALMMVAFGVGTIPANLASAFGLSILRRLSLSAVPRIGLGLSLAALGVFLFASGLPSGALCLSR